MTPPTEIQRIEAKVDRVLTILTGDGQGPPGLVEEVRRAHSRLDDHDEMEENRAADRRSIMVGLTLAVLSGIGGFVMAAVGWAKHGAG